jgi:hypothetical protein
MSGRLLIRFGTATETAAFTGARVETGPGAGVEVTVDETNNRVVVHDGSTPGGHPAARLDEVTGAGFDALITTWLNSRPTTDPSPITGVWWLNGGILAKS